MKRFVHTVWKWIDDRLGIVELIHPSMKHLVPRDAGWWYVFGSATMVAFIVQIGVLDARQSQHSVSLRHRETLGSLPTPTIFDLLDRRLHLEHR
jgi:ubiquinol-cytochrome c reductase cytochrome b subunit